MWNLSQIYVDVLPWKDFPVELCIWKNIHISTGNMYLFESEHGTEYQRPVLVWQDCKNAEKYQRSTLSVKKNQSQNKW